MSSQRVPPSRLSPEKIALVCEQLSEMNQACSEAFDILGLVKHRLDLLEEVILHDPDEARALAEQERLNLPCDLGGEKHPWTAGTRSDGSHYMYCGSCGIPK